MRRCVVKSCAVVVSLCAALSATAPARADLVGWWPLEDDVDDYSGRDNHGFFDFAVFDDNVPADVGSETSLDLDGTSGVDIPAEPSLDSPIFTLSMFIFDRGQAGNYSRTTSRGNDTFETAVGPGGALSYFSRPDGRWSTTPHTVPFETWQHLAFVSTGFEFSVYADGELVHGPVPLTMAPSGVMHIGNRHNNTEGFNGLMDDVALFDEPLDSDQILDLAELGTERFLEDFVPRRPGPSGLLATSGDGEVLLTWDDVDGAAGYNVYRSEDAGGPYEKVNQEIVAASEFRDGNVENGIAYFYVVTSIVDDVESIASIRVAAIPRAPLENPLDALVGWWPFDDDLSDRSGNQNHGRMNNAVFGDYIPDAIADGKSLSLDGTGGVAIDPELRLDSVVFTLSMFILDRGQMGNFSRTTSRGDDSFETAVGGGGTLSYFSRAEGSWNQTPHTVPFETWQHLAFVSTGIDLTIYADGEVVHGPVPLTTTPGGVMHIGDRHNGFEGFNGLMDDVALFDDVLTADHIAQIAESGIAEFLGNPPELEGPPVPPGGLRAVAGDHEVALDWDDVDGAEGYNVHRSEIVGGPYETLNPALLTRSEFVDSDVEVGIRVYYVVTAVNANGESLSSVEVTAVVSTPVADPEESLVGWWPFDGSVEDASGRGNDGFFVFAVFDANVPDAIGDGTSLALDGTGGVEILENPTLDSAVFSLTFFVYNLGQVASYSRMTSRGNDSFETALGTGGGGDQLKYYSPAEGAWSATEHLVPLDVWQHVAYVSTGTELFVYADGELVHGPVPLTTAPLGVMHIGNRHNNTEGVNALMDDVALFNGVLSPEQVEEIAEGGVARFLSSAPPVSETFVRGDANADGNLNITDPIGILGWLFSSGTEPPCQDAADTNDDGGINVSDSVFLLSFLFGGGEALPPPGPSGNSFGQEDCGPDPTGDAVGCLSFTPCR